MPVRPAPITYTCPSCHWSKTVTPRSDALMPGEFFTSCPKCGHGYLETRNASVLGAAASLLERMAGNVLGKR